MTCTFRMTGTILILGCLAAGPINAAEREDTPPVKLRTSDHIPSAWLQGSNYSILGEVENDGVVNTYTVQSSNGRFNVESTALLLKRLSELRALEHMEALKNTETFTEALKTAGKAPVDAVKGLVNEPVDTVKGIGTGLGRWFKDMGRSITSDDPHQPSVWTTAVGHAPVKRQFAYEYGVDPYSSFDPLQKELDSVAWAATSGGVSVKAAFALVGGGVGTALNLTGTAEGMRALIRDKSPAELNKLLEEYMVEIGVPADVRERFMSNNNFNPQEKVFLVGELVAMKGIANRSTLLSTAAVAPDEAVALYMRVRAQMMGRYMEDHESIRIVEAGSTPFLQQADGSIIGFFPLDHVRWTPFVHQRMAAMSSDLKKVPGVSNKKMVILGTVHPEARKALNALGWELKEQLLDQLLEAMDTKG